MNRCKMFVFALGGFAMLLFRPLSAETVDVNRLLPYDNTIINEFWDTTQHPDAQVSRVCDSIPDFNSDYGISTELSNGISLYSWMPGFSSF